MVFVVVLPIKTTSTAARLKGASQYGPISNMRTTDAVVEANTSFMFAAVQKARINPNAAVKAMVMPIRLIVVRT